MNNNPNNNVNEQPVITSNVPAAPAVPTNAVANNQNPSTTTTTPAAAPTQQRVQLVNDQPALKAIAPGDIPKKEEKVSENTEVLDVTTPPAEEKKGGCMQNFFLIVLFGGLFAFVFFIDDISSYIETQKYLKEQVVETITTGTLSCTSERSDDNLDYAYDVNFYFTDSKLKRLNYTTEIRGDINLDAERLDTYNNECMLVKDYASNLSGIDITCSLENGTYKQKQIFTYDSIDRDEAKSAFVEAGGLYPDYYKDQNIDEIEKDMNAAGYSCERIK